MRANERKGAWILMTGIVVLGFILWIFGKCQGSNDSFSTDDNGNPGVEMRTLASDTVENEQFNDYSRKAKRRNQRKGERDKAKVRNKTVKPSKKKIRVRDILADTIPTE